MAGSAYDVMKTFWDIQDTGDYARLADLFAEDCVLDDPVWGTYEGKQAILEFMVKMVQEMGSQEKSFKLLELQADENVAWAKWLASAPEGEAEGCGIYRVEGGKIAYYADYYKTPNLMKFPDKKV